MLDILSNCSLHHHKLSTICCKVNTSRQDNAQLLLSVVHCINECVITQKKRERNRVPSSFGRGRREGEVARERQNAASRGEFAKQICAEIIACDFRGLVQSPSAKYPLQSVWIRVIIKQRKAVDLWIWHQYTNIHQPKKRYFFVPSTDVCE